MPKPDLALTSLVAYSRPGPLHPALILIIMVAYLAQGGQSQFAELNLPYGPATRLASPNGSQILYGVPYQDGVNNGPQLWIEDAGTHQRQMLLSLGGTLLAVWSSDGSAFSVQDHYASDAARTYIYDARTLKRVDLASRILAVDPEAERFASGHAYFDLEGWENIHQVIIRLHGHTDQSPVACFDSRYRIDRSGAVTKLSQRVFPIDLKKLCEK